MVKRSRMGSNSGAPAPQAPAAPRTPDVAYDLGIGGAAPKTEGRPRWEIAALILLVTLAIFSGALRADFIIFDDPQYVKSNAHVTPGLTLEGIGWFLHTPHGANWHPLTSVSHMADVQWFGLAPGGHHAVNVLLHGLGAALLFFALERMTRMPWRSAAAVLLWAVHPLRVESVAWISERKDVLSGAFFMLVLLAYGRWSRDPSARRMAWVALWFGLGLLAKSMLVTVPGVLLLLDSWPLGASTAGPGEPRVAASRSLGVRLREKWALVAMAVALALVTFLVQRSSGAVQDLDRLPLDVRAANAVVSTARYIGMTLWPVDLAPIYPLHRPIAPWSVVAAGALLLALTAFVLSQWRRRTYLAIGWLWYLGMLVPVIGLVQVGSQSHADRYTYLPTIGLIVAGVWAVADWAADSKARRTAAAVLLLGALGCLGAATVKQVGRWKDSRTLFAWTLSVTRDNAIAQRCQGEAMMEAGDPQAAEAFLQEAVRLDPGYAEAHEKLGVVFGQLGRLNDASAAFKRALELREDVETRHNLGHSLARLGRLDEAVMEFEKALRLDPDHVLTHSHLGAALLVRGDTDRAKTHLARSLALNPENLGARRQYAAALLALGQFAEGIGEYKKLLVGNPSDLDVLNSLAWLLATHPDAAYRDGAEAVRLAERARGLLQRPVATLEATAAAAYAEVGRFADAVSSGEQAVSLARAAGAAEEARKFAEQLAGYRAGKPYHIGN